MDIDGLLSIHACRDGATRLGERGYLPRYVPIGNDLRARIEAHIGRSE